MKRFALVVVTVVMAGMTLGLTQRPAAAADVHFIAGTAMVTPGAAEPSLRCFVGAPRLPMYDGPSPWTEFYGYLAAGEVVKSYEHPVYVTEDGWRYVFNERDHGWVRVNGLKEVACGGVK